MVVVLPDPKTESTNTLLPFLIALTIDSCSADAGGSPRGLNINLLLLIFIYNNQIFLM
jgi:hypothetical protein